MRNLFNGFSVLFFGLAAIGCGGDRGNDTGLYQASGGTGGSSGSAGSSSGGSGAVASGGSGGTPIDLEKQIDPIAVGRKWTYDVTVYGVYAYCQEGVHSGEVLGEDETDGKHSYQIQSLCPAAGVSDYAVDGDRVWVHYAGEWVLALDAPVEADHSWSNGVATFAWESSGSVTVPAGTFDDCWTAREQVDYESYTIFCRGVGPIHWHSKTTAGNGFDAVLNGKNF